MKKMAESYLTIKKLAEEVGGNITPRMVRHYHKLGLLPEAARSPANYRLYTWEDVGRLRRIVALKQQGFQLEHIRKLLAVSPDTEETETLVSQLQGHYQAVVQKLVRMRHTASALERLLGRDRACQTLRSEAIANLQRLTTETQQVELLSDEFAAIWDSLDAAIPSHPEGFQESLRYLLPDLSPRSEIEVDLISKLVLACGDVSIANFITVGKGAIAAARHSLNSRCQIIGDVPPIVAALDRPRLAHLGCPVDTLIDNPHIISATEAEREFWDRRDWHERLEHLPNNCIIIVGYAPSVLVSVCQAIGAGKLQPALIIGMPVGFSHAPAAKRRLKKLGIPFITTEGTIGGGLLAAIALNALAESLIEKPDCHCYLTT